MGIFTNPLFTYNQMRRGGNKNKLTEIVGPMRLEQARAEANRCLFCYDAPCVQACPTKINVPQFIKRIASEDITGAARSILTENILGGTCARVCPTEELCEGACVLKAEYDQPIRIAQLQRFATDWFFTRRPPIFQPLPPSGKRVAIIGGGPAGLACAAYLALKGHKAVIFESKSQAGGLNTFAITPFKIKPAFIRKEIAFIKSLGVKIKTNVTVGKDMEFAKIHDSYDAIFIAIGLGKTESLRIPGEQLSGIIEALDFLARARSTLKIGKKVAVIGGGNTALDAAIMAKILGAEEVNIIYRRSSAEMPGYFSELQMARLQECRFFWLTELKRIMGKERVTGVQCLKTRLGPIDASGRCRPIPIKGSEFLIEADMVIKALGQQPHQEFLAQLKGLRLSKEGLIKVNKKTCATSLPGVFAGGDCVVGGGEVVDAVAMAKLAAQAIDQFLQP